MTTATTTVPARDHVAQRVTGGLTFPRLLRSEWIKFATLRSPWYSIGLVAVVTVGLGMLLASATADDLDLGGIDTGALAIQSALAPTIFTVLLAAILGSTLVTSEYSTGMMRSTLTAAPGRVGSLLARAVVVGLLVFVASTVIFLGTALAVSPILAGGGISLDLADAPQSWFPLLGGAVTMSVIALLGLSAGYLLRNGAGAIAAAVAIVFVLPIVPRLFPETPAWQWVHDGSQYLPTNAGSALMTNGSPVVETFSSSTLSPAAAGLTLAVWAVAGLASAAVALRVRDA